LKRIEKEAVRLMTIDPMTKMYISFLAMAFMFICNFLMIYARKLQKAVISLVLKMMAGLMLLSTFIMILIVVFA
jgi:hypothetical protein